MKEFISFTQAPSESDSRQGLVYVRASDIVQVEENDDGTADLYLRGDNEYSTTIAGPIDQIMRKIENAKF